MRTLRLDRSHNARQALLVTVKRLVRGSSFGHAVVTGAQDRAGQSEAVPDGKFGEEFEVLGACLVCFALLWLWARVIVSDGRGLW